MAYARSYGLFCFWPVQILMWQHSCKLLWSLKMSADTVNKTNHVKKIICLGLLLISIYAKAGSCSVNGTGDWETPGTWSCGHAPGAGDNVTIGAGIIITVTANNLANIGNLSIFGTLQFTNGSKINLASASVVNIYSGGSITGGNGGAKLVFPSTSYAGPFSTTGPFFFSNGGSGTGLLSFTLVSFYSSLQIRMSFYIGQPKMKRISSHLKSNQEGTGILTGRLWKSYLQWQAEAAAIHIVSPITPK